MKRVFQTLRAEPAIAVALLARIWQSSAGLLTLLLLIRFLTPLNQGYYQTFLSLVALQSFLELGILIAIVSVVSHEWVGLDLSENGLVGMPEQKARLAALVRFVSKWFAGAGFLFLVVGGGIGYLVLAQQGNQDEWRTAWVATIILAASNFSLQGFIAVLEGCNQIMSVALFRLVQTVVGTLCLWGALAADAGLWSLAFQLAAVFATTAAFLLLFHSDLFKELLRGRGLSSFDWKLDLWPMQWPLALQGAVAYFNFAVFAPVIYTYHGAIEAGRIGLTVQIVTALTSIGAAFLAVRAPRMGTAFARGDMAAYRSLFSTTAAMSAGSVTIGAITVMALLLLGYSLDAAAVDRVLEPTAFAALLAWGIVLSITQCLAAAWRSQRIEPVGFLGAVPGLVSGAAVWLLGSRYGTTGAAWGAFGAIALTALPISIHFFRANFPRVDANSRRMGPG